MRARFAYVDALTKIKTRSAVQAAYDNTRDLLRLCRGDNMGVRELLPSLLLRLGRDQECYDFVKWYADDRPTYDWGDPSLPYLDIKDADVLERVDMFTGDSCKTCHSIAVTLIKIRLLLELQTLRDSKMIGTKVPQEILDNVQGQLLSYALKINPMKRELLEDDDAFEQIRRKLKHQIAELHEFVNEANPHFWSALLNPGRNLTAPLSAYSIGSYEEMQLYLQYSYDAWVETPGAIETIKLLEDDEFMNEFLNEDDEIY